MTAMTADAGAVGPLTEAQHQIWALDRLDPPPATVNLNYALTIDGRLDVAALSEAFADVVGVHEPLRTRYPERAAGAVAEPVDTRSALSGLDLSPGRDLDPEEAAELVRQERNRGFDLSRDTPLRVRLARLPHGRHLLVFTLHHIAADGWSLQLLSRQLSRAYSARRRGERAELRRPPAECVELARRQQRWLDGPECDRELDWWAERLDGATLRPLPSAVSDTSRVTASTCHTVPVPAELTAQLRKLGREAGSSLYGLFLTAFQVLLRLRYDSDNALIGSLAANRTSAEAGEVLGAHYNALLMNTEFGADPTLAECLLATSARASSTLDHQTVPYRLLADRLERDHGRPADDLPGVMFLMDEYPMARLRLDGCEVTGLSLQDVPDPSHGGAVVPGAAPSALIFFVREFGQALSLSVLTAADVFDEKTPRGLARGYLEILTAMCQTPELPIAELDLCFEPLDGGEPAVRRPVLRPVATIAPVEALSPVGRWYRGALSDVAPHVFEPWQGGTR